MHFLATTVNSLIVKYRMEQDGRFKFSHLDLTRNIFILPRLHLDSSVAFSQSCLIFILMALPFVSVAVGLVLIISLAPPS